MFSYINEKLNTEIKLNGNKSCKLIFWNKLKQYFGVNFIHYL